MTETSLQQNTIQILTPYDAKQLQRVTQDMGEFRHVIVEATLQNNLDPLISQLAMPTADADHRQRMGANIALRTMVDYQQGLSAITRLGPLASIELMQDTGALALQIAAAPVSRGDNGLYFLT